MEKEPVSPPSSSPSFSPGAGPSPRAQQPHALQTGSHALGTGGVGGVGGVGGGIAMVDFASGSPFISPGGGGGRARSPLRLRRRATLSSPSPADDVSRADYVSSPGALDTPGSAEEADMKLMGRMLEDDHLADSKGAGGTDTYGVAELRDGFFDALFLRPAAAVYAELMAGAEKTLPAAFDRRRAAPLSLSQRRFFPTRQWRDELWAAIRGLLTTREGVRLAKSFGAFFTAYVLCLVPEVRAWLGRYNYVMVISTIINHPARTVGAQLDGAVLTTVGTAAGLGWGVVGLLLSTSTDQAKTGYGAILAVFLATFMVAIACIRSYFIRLYQLVLCAGMAIIYTCLSEVNGRRVAWSKLYAYAVPWMLGQAISLVVCILIWPDAGARPLAEAFHTAFGHVLDGLQVPRPRNTRLRRRLAQTYVDLSTAYRDMRIDTTVMRFHPDDVGELRNRMQAVVRALLSLKTETTLFDGWEEDEDEEKMRKKPCANVAMTNVPNVPSVSVTNEDQESPPTDSEATVVGNGRVPATTSSTTLLDSDELARMVATALRQPTKDLLEAMRDTIRSCDAVFMDLSGYRSYLGPPKDVSSDVDACQVRLKTAMSAFDDAEGSVLSSGDLPTTYTGHPEVINLLVFVRHIRMASSPVQVLLEKLHEMQFKSDYPKVYFPSYPLAKALNRTNEQVRHDRGGVTAGSYHTTFGEIAHLVEKIKAREYNPMPREQDDFADPSAKANDSHATMEADIDGEPKSKRGKLGYRIWKVLHRLQGFESKYALKVVLLTALLSIPGYLTRTRTWWNEYDAWWAVSIAWIMSHPRAGGNIQDLLIRVLSVIIGCIWSGLAWTAGDGSPIVMGAFAFVYMIPMMYRFTQSSQPRSGLIGCISFTIISLGLMTSNGQPSPLSMAVTRGVFLLSGAVAAVLVNWLLWPFVSRHALRKSLSGMLFFLSIIYRSVVARYIYYEAGQGAPSEGDVRRSEMLEGRLREGFVRVRQLLVLTRHEMRLRAPFDPLPYSALADACERFFEFLLGVRQAAVHYRPEYVSGDSDNDVATERLLAYRRDAVASILGNLYILAGAMKSGRKVPRYLPSAAAARKRLLDKMAEVDADMSAYAEAEDIKAREKWSQLYHYSYNESLTGCVKQLEDLEKYVKLIVGEQGFDDELRAEDTDDSDTDVTHGLGPVR